MTKRTKTIFKVLMWIVVGFAFIFLFNTTQQLLALILGVLSSRMPKLKKEETKC